MQKHLSMIDLTTGELVGEGVPVWFGVRHKSPYADGWVAMNQHFLREFAARKDVTGEVFRVFLYLDARLNFRNLIQIPQTEIAKELGIRKQHVNRAIRKLENLGIILRDPNAAHISAWRLNPNAGWKGKVKELRPAIERHAHSIKMETEQEE
jgi:DNA-binding MarR family transcriptional regulator